MTTPDAVSSLPCVELTSSFDSRQFIMTFTEKEIFE